VLGGVLTSVFVPVVVEQLRTRRPDQAWEGLSALVTCSVAVLLVTTLLVAAAAPLIISIFSGRVGGAEGAQQQELATFLLRLFAPQVLLYGLVAIGDGLLNSYGRFALPAFAPILNNLLVIAAFLAFAAVVAGTPTNASVDASLGQKLLLGAGTTAGVAAMAIVYWPAIRRLPGRLRVRLELRHPAVVKLARLSGWTAGYVVTNVAGLVVSFYLANGVQGGPTAYVTAFAFFQLPIGIAAISVVTAITPKLAAHHVDADRPSFRARLAGGLRLTALLMLPATAGYLALAEPLSKTLLEHGVTQARSAELVASVLQLFAVGLLPFAAFQLLMRAFYASHDARSPALINVAENGVTVALAFALFPVLEVRGLALAHSLGYVAGCALALAVLRRRVGALEGGRTLSELLRMTLAAAVAGAGMLAASGLLGAASIPALILGGLTGLTLFCACAWVLRVTELTELRDQLRHRLWR
jgi:putative peptidoglycan lipid II flippase